MEGARSPCDLRTAPPSHTFSHLFTPLLTTVIDRHHLQNLNTQRKATWSDELIADLLRDEDSLTHLQQEALHMLQKAQVCWGLLHSPSPDQHQTFPRATIKLCHVPPSNFAAHGSPIGGGGSSRSERRTSHRRCAA